MDQPIFILSCPRSGSTLLRYVLDTHPAVYAPPELSLGGLAGSLAVALAGLNGKRPATPPFDTADPPEILALVGDTISRLMDEHTRRRGKTVWCEKSPQNMRSLDLLISLYPDARYICLYRNHLDTIESCLDSSRYGTLPPLVEYILRNPRSPLRATADYWIDVTAKLLDLERSGQCRTHRLRYEDLVTSPAEALSGLFAFLDLEWSPGLIDAIYKTPHDYGLGDPFAPFDHKIRRDSVGRGRALPAELLAEDRRARIEEINGELGYAELIAEILAAPPPAREGAAAAPATGKGPRWVFETHVPARCAESPEALAGLDASYRFLVSGEGGGSWLLRRGPRGDLEVLEEDRPEADAATTTIGLDATDLLEIVEGRVHVVRLQQDGRLRFSGETLGLKQIESLIALFRPG